MNQGTKAEPSNKIRRCSPWIGGALLAGLSLPMAACRDSNARGEVRWSVPEKQGGRSAEIKDVIGYLDPTPSRPRIVLCLFDRRVSSQLRSESHRTVRKEAVAEVSLVFAPDTDPKAGAEPSYVHAEGVTLFLGPASLAQTACKLSGYAYDPQASRVEFSMECAGEGTFDASGAVVTKHWDLDVDAALVELH